MRAVKYESPKNDLTTRLLGFMEPVELIKTDQKFTPNFEAFRFHRIITKDFGAAVILDLSLPKEFWKRPNNSLPMPSTFHLSFCNKKQQ